MVFEKIEYAVIALIVTIIFIILRKRFYSTFFNKVKKFWFYKPTKTRVLSNFIYYISFIVLVLAVGDLRGKEEVIEGNIPTQKTLIVIDNSLSMLVEDIRPNRIKKSLLLARHFIRNSYGHQVSIAVFSDLFKQLIPFTDDIEILEARLQTLNEAKSEGGSNIGNTLNEAFQFFKTKNGYEKGNIILFTDGEEQGDSQVKIPDEISLAVVAVGSENGGKIPLRSKDGQFQRYKKFNNEEVVSKIDKKFFGNLEKSGKYVKVWFAQSYSLPTEEIVTFLTNIHESSFQKGSFRQRPVKGIPLIALFVCLYIVSVLLSRFRTFSVATFLCVLLLSSQGTKAEELDTKIEEYLSKYKNGEISKEEKLDLAQLYLNKNESDKSSAIYRSVIKDLDSERVEDIFNFGTSLLKEGKTKDAMSLYRYLDKNRQLPEEMSDIIKKNLMHALKKEEEQQKQKQDEKEDQNDQNEQSDSKDNKQDNNQENKKDNKNNKNKDQKNNKDKNNQSGDQKDQNKNQSSNDEKNENSGDKSKEEQDKDKNKQDKGDEQNKDKDEKNNEEGEEKDKNKDKGKSFEDIKKEIELNKKKNGVKGVLKQIMNDDANLQRMFINSSSKDNSKEAKDW